MNARMAKYRLLSELRFCGRSDTAAVSQAKRGWRDSFMPREEHVQRPKERKLKSYTGPDREFNPCQGVWTSC